MPKRRRRPPPTSNPLFSDATFWVLLGLVVLALLVSTYLHLHLLPMDARRRHEDAADTTTNSKQHQPPPQQQQQQLQNPPQLPPLPAFPVIPNAAQLIHQTLYQNQPSIAGIGAILYGFLRELHASNQHLAQHPDSKTKDEVRQDYFDLVEQHLMPLESAYRGRNVFSVRTDNSIFVSIAAYREHLLADTLASLYTKAAHPEKLHVGVVVNNCFATDGTCQGGVQVVGKDKKGHDKLQQVNGVPDTNHIETFCHNQTFAHYCTTGQVRVLYVNESEALGPSVARYYSSKLWGGETYYMQIDSHLHFAPRFDELYIQELQATRAYPKAILSTYPPGFTNFKPTPPFTRGTRLCRCRLRWEEGFLPRVEMEGRYSEAEIAAARPPTQMAFVGAGFFFAPAEFLVDVPFDPFLPFLFMGEEIALSIRAWTHGWNIYAPRVNLIGHQYRPLEMGTPHYDDSIRKLLHKPGLVAHSSNMVRNRIKYMMGYPHLNVPQTDVLQQAEHYGLGTVRTREAYLKFAEIDLEKQTCGPMKWCTQGLLE